MTGKLERIRIAHLMQGQVKQKYKNRPTTQKDLGSERDEAYTFRRKLERD